MKGKEPEKARLLHILEAIKEIGKYLDAAGSEDDFYRNSALKFATVKQLEIIGEAAGKLSADTRKLAGNMEWHAIISMRNRMVHDYEQIDFTIVYQVAKDELQELKETVEEMLKHFND